MIFYCHCPFFTTNRALEDHRRKVLQDNGRDSPSTGKKSKNHRRKPPNPPSSANHHSDEITSLDLVGLKKREKGTHHSPSRPKSEFIPVRSAPLPPARCDSLKRLTNDNQQQQITDKPKDGSMPDAISPATRKRLDTYLSTTSQPLNTDPGMGSMLDKLAAAQALITSTSSAQQSTNSAQNPTSSAQPLTSHPFRLVTENETGVKLPTEFEPEMAAEIIDLVRNR